MENITKPGGVDSSTRGNLKQHEEVRTIVGELMKGVNRIEAYTEIGKFAQHLKATHEDWNKYQLYHVLAMSTPDYSLSTITEDFKGEDSIVKFLNSLKAKYQVKPEAQEKIGRA